MPKFKKIYKHKLDDDEIKNAINEKVLVKELNKIIKKNICKPINTLNLIKNETYKK